MSDSKTPTRFRDTPNELRIRLRRTLKLHEFDGEGGEQFYHEAVPKGQQIIAATSNKDHTTIDVGIFLDRAKRLLLEEELKPLIEKFTGSTVDNVVMVACTYVTSMDGVNNGLRSRVAALEARIKELTHES